MIIAINSFVYTYGLKYGKLDCDARGRQHLKAVLLRLLPEHAWNRSSIVTTFSSRSPHKNQIATQKRAIHK